MEDQCARMLDYKLHKDKEGLARFSKQESSTMKTLNKLRERGVKVNVLYTLTYLMFSGLYSVAFTVPFN